MKLHHSRTLTYHNYFQTVKFRNLKSREAQLSRVVFTSVFFWALAWTPYAGESHSINFHGKTRLDGRCSLLVIALNKFSSLIVEIYALHFVGGQKDYMHTQ